MCEAFKHYVKLWLWRAERPTIELVQFIGTLFQTTPDLVIVDYDHDKYITELFPLKNIEKNFAFVVKKWNKEL